MNSLVLVLASIVALIPADARPQTERVWWWFAACGGPMMTIEVKSGALVVTKASVPLCRAPRDSRSSQGGAGRIDFSFRPRQPIVWRGYRDKVDRTSAGEDIQGSLWEAGADHDALLIGVSFSTQDRILVNTIHIAHPNLRDQSNIASGLTVITYPTTH